MHDNGDSPTSSAAPENSYTDGAQSTPPVSSAGQPRKPSRHVPLWNNALTLLGVFLAVSGVVLLSTFGLFNLVTPASNPYVDIIGYLVFPAILLGGLVLTPVGMLFKSWRLRRGDPVQRLSFGFSQIDLRDAEQRKAAIFFVFGTIVFLPVVAVSGYHGYHYTDSTDFCSRACHTVMEPQAVAHSRSSHARVPCAECHIGAGANWVVKSKLSGTRQVIATWRKSYSRPIPPAIKHLRPARETCEECHWPEKFFGAQLREIVRFGSDEANTRREVKMVLKTGGGGGTTGRPEGIHLHTSSSICVEFVATDEKLQQVPWVRFTDAVGEVTVFRSDGRPHAEPPPPGQFRRMDCMDCHNRPAHAFRLPTDAVDESVAAGKIDSTLPHIKREAVTALDRSYPDLETARARIERSLTGFYEASYPEVCDTRRPDLDQAIGAVFEIYRQNVFPYMRVDWRTYPDNIGHKASPGCFRCHDGRHVDQEGRPISHECRACHTFLNPVGADGERGLVSEGEFQHSAELAGTHASLRCDQCHTGGSLPERTCSGCHTAQAELLAGTAPGFQAFNISADPMADAVECEGCHDLDEPTDIETIGALCLDCHDDEQERFDGLLTRWDQEIERLLVEAEARADSRGREVLRALRKAGPLHNIAAARSIAQAFIEDSPSPATEP